MDFESGFGGRVCRRATRVVKGIGLEHVVAIRIRTREGGIAAGSDADFIGVGTLRVRAVGDDPVKSGVSDGVMTSLANGCGQATGVRLR